VGSVTVAPRMGGLVPRFEVGTLRRTDERDRQLSGLPVCASMSHVPSFEMWGRYIAGTKGSTTVTDMCGSVTNLEICSHP
jgi:hypothetical protein